MSIMAIGLAALRLLQNGLGGTLLGGSWQLGRSWPVWGSGVFCLVLIGLQIR